MSKLFTPLNAGAFDLSHRVVLAPMTRLRTIQPGDISSPMMAQFYGQRASKGGLVIIEVPASRLAPAPITAPPAFIMTARLPAGQPSPTPSTPRAASRSCS